MKTITTVAILLCSFICKAQNDRMPFIENLRIGIDSLFKKAEKECCYLPYLYHQDSIKSNFGKVISTDTISPLFKGPTLKTFGDSLFTISTNEPVVYDTIKVIMLLADTSHYIHTYSVLHNNTLKTIRDTSLAYKFTYTYWEYGYTIKQKENNSGYSIWQENIFTPSPKYLDQNKKELGKNIVVWQSMECK